MSHIIIADSQIVLTSSYLKIHSVKNISNFQKNFAKINEFVQKMSEAEKEFKIPSFREYLDYLHTNKSNYNKNFLVKMQKATLRNLKQCKNYVQKKNFQANDIFKKTLNQHQNQRNKRGLKILGEIFSQITDIPSPTQWSDENKLIDDLKRIVSGEKNETHELKISIESQEKIIENMIPSLSKLSKNLEKSETTMDLFSNIIIDHLDFEFICNQGKQMVDELLREANSIKNVKEKALELKPDESLFPLEKIIEITENFHKSNKENSPVFGSDLEINQIYSMSSAVTIIEKDNIHSLLTIPIADFSYQFNFIPHPTLNSKDIKTINELSKIALKNIDIFTCTKNKRNLRLFSSRDLERCSTTPNAELHICRGRKSNVPTTRNMCEKFQLPSSLFIELSPNMILVKSNLKVLHESCPNSSSKIFLNSTYSIINIPTICELHGDNFYVGKFDHNERKSFKSTYIAKTFEFPNITGNFDEIKSSSVHKMFSANISTIQEHISLANSIDNQNQKNYEVLLQDFNHFKNGNTMESIINWTVRSLTIFITVLITIFVLYKICRKFYRKRNEQNNETKSKSVISDPSSNA